VTIEGVFMRWVICAAVAALWSGAASAQAVDNLPSRGALAREDALPLDWRHPKKAPIDWRLKAEYVATGDLDADEGAPLAENKTNLSGGLDYVHTFGTAAKLTTSADASLADDYSKRNENGSSYGLGVKLASVAKLAGWEPSIGVSWTQNRKEFFGAYDRDDVTYSLEATTTIPLRVSCDWRTGADPCLALSITPSLSQITSSDDGAERASGKVKAGLTGVTAFGVRIMVEGVVERREYSHNLTGAYKRNDDRAEAYVGANAGDLAKGVLRDVNLSTLKDLWLGARYVRQESNSRDPTHSYDRLQLVFTLKFGGVVYYPAPR